MIRAAKHENLGRKKGERREEENGTIQGVQHPFNRNSRRAHKEKRNLSKK